MFDIVIESVTSALPEKPTFVSALSMSALCH